MKRILILLLIFITSKSISQQYPKTMANGGNIGGMNWTIKDYKENAEKDSIMAVKIKQSNLETAENYKDVTLKDYKNQKIKKKELAEAISKTMSNYENSVKEINLTFEDKLTRIKNYRDEWIEYLNYELQKKEKQLAQRKFEDEAQEKENAENKKNSLLRENEDKKKYENIGNSIEYKNWKSSYLSLIQSAQVNVNSCNEIIKKHTYLNRLKEKIYDSSTFTKQEKATFNKNLDLLENKLKQIRALEENRDLYLYFADKATNNETTASYNLSTFFNTTSKCY